MTTASKSAAGSALMLPTAAWEALILLFPTLEDGPLASVHAVKGQGAARHHATLGRGRCALYALAHHVGRTREETVLMRIIGRPHDLVRADIVGQHGDTALD